MKTLVYATKINNSELTGLMDISKNPPKLYCFCTKEVAEEILENRKKNFKIQVYKNDEIDGFAAYASPSIKKNEFGVVVFNLEASLGVCIEEELSFKEMFVETIMHEVGHALEEFYDLEFSEERIEKITDGYRQKYFTDEESQTNNVQLTTENKTEYSILEEVDFFDLMQSYRITDQSNQENVIKRFNSVKEFIKDNFVPKKSEEILENKTEIEWREQNSKFGLDYSTKTGKWEDYKFDIRYDYDGNPDEKPSKCILNLTIMKKGEIIERERSYSIEDLVSFSNIYMLDEQRKFLKGKFN